MAKSKLQTFLLLATVLGLAGVSCSVMTTRADSFDWLHDYEEALRSAKAEKKPIFAYLETDWCTYCRQMEATTLKDEAMIASMRDQYVWLKLNAESDAQGRALRDRFSIVSYPGMLILDSDGEEIDRLSGYLSVQDFQKKVTDYTHGPRSFRRLKERAEQEPDDGENLFYLAERHREREEFRSSAEAYAGALKSDPENVLGLADQSLYYQSLSLTMVNEVADVLPLLDALERDYPESPLVPDSVLLRGQIYSYAGLKGKARTTFSSYLDKYPDHGYAGRVRQILSSLGGQGMPLVSSH